MTDNKYTNYILITILFFGFFFRFYFVNHESLWPDEALYLYMGDNLSSDLSDLRDTHGNFFLKNPPFYMYLLSILFRFAKDWAVFGARLFSVIADTGTILLVYLIAKKTFDKPVGLISAGIIAVNPLHIWISTRILTDIPLTFLLYFSIYMLISKRIFFYYIFSFLSLVTKYTAAPVFALGILRKIRFPKKIWALIYCSGVIGIITLIAANSHMNMEKGLLSYFMRFFQIPNFSEMYREIHFFIGFTLCFFFIVGFGKAAYKNDFSPLFKWVLIFGTARLFLPWVAFRVSRYSLPLYPGMMLFAAYGWFSALDFIRKKMPKISMSVVLLFSAVLVYAMAVSSIKAYDVSDSTSRTFTGFREVGDFLRHQSENRHVNILTSSPRQIKYFVPDSNVYDLPGESSPKDMEILIRDKKIEFVSSDIWSPHQPDWCVEYFVPQNGFHPIFRNENFVVYNYKIRP